MLKGFINTGHNTWGNYIQIRIEGYCENTFYGYALADVKRAYKAYHLGTSSRRVNWIVYKDN